MAQIDNRQMVELLSTYFVRRGETTSSTGSVVSTFLAIPDMRAFIPFSGTHPAYAVLDMISLLHYTKYGNSKLGFEGFIPYGESIISGGGSGWSPGSDHASFKILGANGITLGAWVSLNAVNTGTMQGIISKFRPVANGRAYMLYENEGKVLFRISPDGGSANFDTVTSSNNIVAGEWTFVVGRWFADAMDVWVNGTKTTITPVNSSIYNTTSWLTLMSSYFNDFPAQGKMSMAFISATKLSDEIVDNLWASSRGLFGK